jgi:hypothetical protein
MRMTSADRRFDTFCQANGLGAAATSSNTEPEILAACDSMKRVLAAHLSGVQTAVQQHGGGAIKLFLRFCADSSLNALAARDDKRTYFVVVNTGTLLRLRSVFEWLFARSPITTRHLAFGPTENATTPSQILTTTALLAACHFIVFHEIGHIVYGHADLLASTPSRPDTRVIAEANHLAANNSISADLLQSMELNADLYASSSLAYSIAQGEICGHRTGLLLQSSFDVFSASLVAILTMFHMFYGGDATIENYQSQSHPVPEIRFLNFLIRAWQFRAVGLPLFRHTRPEETFGHILKTWIPTDLQRQIFPAFNLQGEVEFMREFERVMMNEDRLRCQLAPFALIPVPTVIV